MGIRSDNYDKRERKREREREIQRVGLGSLIGRLCDEVCSLLECGL